MERDLDENVSKLTSLFKNSINFYKKKPKL